jgi:membrane-bound lytic murein transglycosylase B
MRRLAIALILLVPACTDDESPEPTTTTSTSTSTTSTSTTTTTAVPAAAPVAAADPAGLARQIDQGETAARDPARSAAGRERGAWEAQVAYRALGERPEWIDDVERLVPEVRRGTVRANAEASAELRALTKPQTKLPPWRIVAPAPADELLSYYRAAEAEIGVPWPYLAAIHLVETRMGRIRGTSTAGAQGPMQFLPSTWSQYGAGGDINSNRDAILAAARLLKRNGAPGNMANALFNYNRSQRYVKAVTNYAEQMRADEQAYFAYYHWQVYYRMVDGDRHLPVGYEGT